MKMFPWVWFGTVSLSTFTAVAADSAPKTPLTGQQKVWLAKAERHEKAGWIYLHVEGSAREMGFQHGYLLAQEIAESIRVTSAYWHHNSSKDWPWLIQHTKKFINRGIDRELRAELDGIAEGMNAAGFASTPDDIITYNASIETTGYWWPEVLKKNRGQIDVAKAKAMEADCYDTCLNKENPSGRTLVGHFELDPQLTSAEVPYSPGGTFDSKVVDTALAKRMSFAARWGSADGTGFDADKFLAEHPQFDWQAGLLKSRPVEPWVEFTAGEK